MADEELPADEEDSEELIRIETEEDAWKAFEDAINGRFAEGSAIH